MGKLNMAVNRLLKRKEIFADLINGSIFEGMEILRPEKLESRSGHAGILTENKDKKLIAAERFRDIHMESDFETYSVLFATEIQGFVHYAMPVRIMLYDALEYVKQIQDIENFYLKNNEKLKGDSLLSGMKKEDRLKPVITTVFYTGENWDGARSLHELLQMDPGDTNSAELAKHIPNYCINLIDARKIKHSEYFKTCLHHIFNMLKFSGDKHSLMNYLHQHKNEIEQMDQVECQAAFVLLGEQKRMENLLETKKESEEWSVCQAIEEMIKDGEKTGEERGIKLGEERGIKLGEERGIIWGEFLKLVKLVCKKIQKNIPFERIVEDLDEDTLVIRPIYDTALLFAPDYDWRKVYQKIRSESA